jgi:hydrogenase/urease accessory protein HupE
LFFGGVIKALLSIVTAALIILLAPVASWGHAFVSEAVTFRVANGTLIATGNVDFSEIGLQDQNSDGVLDSGELTGQISSISSTLVHSAQKNVLVSVDGHPLAITTAWVNTPPASSSSSPATSQFVSLTLVFQELSDEASEIAVYWNFTSPSDAVILQTKGATILTNLNETLNARFTFNAWSTVQSFFIQGLQHISFGLDHLLFLIVLALGVFKSQISKSTIIQAIKLVSAFTVGHALSFTLAYFGIVTISASVVEPVIALSIVLTAAATLTKRNWEKYWILAGLIGTIHGLGFASSLSQLGIATTEHLAAIASFNIGVDIAQTITVAGAAIVLGMLRWALPSLSEHIRIVIAVGIGILGIFWTLVRSSELIGAFGDYLVGFWQLLF